MHLLVQLNGDIKIGICKGVAAGDHLHVSRYILERLAEMNNAVICWHPKPFKDGWNRSACHTNYSNRFYEKMVVIMV